MDSGVGRYTVIDKKGNVLCEPQDNTVKIMPHYFLTKKLWSYEFSLIERRNGETFLSLHDGILKDKNGKVIFGDLSFTPKRAVVGEEYNILNTKENVWLLKDLNYIYGIAFNKVPLPDTDFPSVCLCIDNPLLNRNEEITLLEKDNYFLTPVLYNERVLIPICVLDDVLEDTQTVWGVESGTASVFRNGMTVQIWSDSFAVLVDRNAVQTDVHAQVISGRVYIPLRFVAETLGFSVFWNDDTKTVTICDSHQTGLAF